MKRWYANVYVLIVVLISLLGIATSSLLFLLIPGPAEVVRTMQWRMAAVHSFTAEADVRYRGTRQVRGASPEPEALTLRLTARRDSTDPSSVKSTDAFSLSVGTDDGAGKAPLAFAGNRAVIGQAQFFNFSQLPAQIGAVRFEQFRAKWLRIDIARLLADTALPFVGGGRPPLSMEQRTELAEEFRITPFVNVTDTLSSEDIGGVATNHYKVKPEILFFRDFYAQEESVRLGRELTSKERLAIETAFADIVPEDGELWIGKRDGLLHRLRARFHFDDGTRNGTVDLAVEFSHLNEPVAVTAPAGDVDDATPFLASLLNGLREHLPMAKEGAVQHVSVDDVTGLPFEVASQGDDDPDKDGLPNALEGFYGTDSRNPDTDGDGMSDGQEVSQGRNPGGPGLLFDFTLSR